MVGKEDIERILGLELARIFGDLTGGCPTVGTYKTNPDEIDRPSGVTGVSRHRLRGDDFELEPIVYEGKNVMRVRSPINQVIRIPDGSKGEDSYRYISPADGGSRRTLHCAYLGGRCRIVIAK